MKRIKSTIKDDVAETLFIPLYMRSVESQRKNAIINDPYAVGIVNKLDFDFSKYQKGKRSSLGVAIRANYFDQKAREFLRRHENAAIVNIGCGLDTRYQRLSNLNNAVFYDMDIPEVIDFRKQVLAEDMNNEQHILLSASMFDTAWMEHIKSVHEDSAFMFIIEGVLMYFQEKKVRQFFVNMADSFPGSEMNFDIINKWMSRNSARHDTVKHTRANFIFGVDDDRDFEKWHPGLKFQEVKLFCDFKEWRRLFFQGLIMQLVPKFKYGGRMLTYKVKK